MSKERNGNGNADCVESSPSSVSNISPSKGSNVTPIKFESSISRVDIILTRTGRMSLNQSRHAAASRVRQIGRHVLQHQCVTQVVEDTE
jgi:hypothetical protein